MSVEQKAAPVGPRYKVRTKHDLPANMSVKEWLKLVKARPMLAVPGALDYYEGEICAVCYVFQLVHAQPLDMMGANFLAYFTPEAQALLTSWRDRYTAGEFNTGLAKYRKQVARAEAAANGSSEASTWDF